MRFPISQAATRRRKVSDVVKGIGGERRSCRIVVKHSRKHVASGLSPLVDSERRSKLQGGS
jgi:hypothetical protein